MLFFCENHYKTPCIYEIINTHTGRRYIGKTKTPRHRWVSGHKPSLLKNKRANSFFQNDFNKCFKELGHTDFLEFHIIELLPGSSPKMLSERELYWIKTYDASYELYNITRELDCHYGMSDETKKKVSDTKKAYYQTEEGKAFVAKESERRRGKSYEEQYGSERAAAIKQKIREDKLIVMNRPAVKENLRKQLTGKSYEERFGAVQAAEINKKKSLARKGKYTGTDSPNMKTVENIQLLSPSGEIFTRIDGIKIFALAHGLTPNTFSELLAGKRKTHKGWRLVNDILTGI